MADRPLLIAIIAVLTILAGLIYLGAGALLATLSESAWNDAIRDASLDVGDITLGFLHTLGYGMVILGIISLIIGYALWSGWTIAWYLGLILFIISLISAVYSIVLGAWFSVIGLVIYALLIYYMFTPKVKDFFGV